MIQVVVGLFTHHDPIEAFRLKFWMLGKGKREETRENHYKWKLFKCSVTCTSRCLLHPGMAIPLQIHVLKLCNPVGMSSLTLTSCNDLHFK